jgi:hypothetical protein
MDAACFCQAHDDIGASDKHMQRAGKSGAADQFDAFPDPESQRAQAVMQAFIGMDAADGGLVARFQAGEVV